MIACVTRKVAGLPMSTVSSSILVHPALTDQRPHVGHTPDGAVVRYIEKIVEESSADVRPRVSRLLRYCSLDDENGGLGGGQYLHRANLPGFYLASRARDRGPLVVHHSVEGGSTYL